MTFTNNMLTTLYAPSSHSDPLAEAHQYHLHDDYHHHECHAISNDDEARSCDDAGADMDTSAADAAAAVFDFESELAPASPGSASHDYNDPKTYPASHAQTSTSGTHSQSTAAPISTSAPSSSSSPTSTSSESSQPTSSASSQPTSTSSSTSSPPTSLPPPSPAPPSSAPSLPEAAHAIRKKPRSYSLHDDFLHAAPAAQAALERFQCHHPHHQRPKSQTQQAEGAQSNDSEQMFSTHCQCSVSAPVLGATPSGQGHRSLPHRGAHSWPNSAHW